MLRILADFVAIRKVRGRSPRSGWDTSALARVDSGHLEGGDGDCEERFRTGRSQPRGAGASYAGLPASRPNPAGRSQVSWTWAGGRSVKSAAQMDAPGRQPGASCHRVVRASGPSQLPMPAVPTPELPMP